MMKNVVCAISVLLVGCALAEHGDQSRSQIVADQVPPPPLQAIAEIGGCARRVDVTYPAPTATIIVAPTGTDSATCGSLAAPCATLAQASTNVSQPGTAIYLRAGIYYVSGPQRIHAHGTAAQPIVIRPYPGDFGRVVLDGSATTLGNYRAIVQVQGAAYVIFDSLEIRSSDQHGLMLYDDPANWAPNESITVRNSKIHDITWIGLGGSGNNTVFEGNDVWN